MTATMHPLPTSPRVSLLQIEIDDTTMSQKNNPTTASVKLIHLGTAQHGGILNQGYKLPNELMLAAYIGNNAPRSWLAHLHL